MVALRGLPDSMYRAGLTDGTSHRSHGEKDFTEVFRAFLALSGGSATRPRNPRDRFRPISPTDHLSPPAAPGIKLSPTVGVLTRARVAVHRREREAPDRLYHRNRSPGLISLSSRVPWRACFRGSFDAEGSVRKKTSLRSVSALYITPMPPYFSGRSPTPDRVRGGTRREPI